MLAQEGNKGTYDNGRQPNRLGTQIIKLSDDFPVAANVDSRLFPGLACRCLNRRLIARLLASTGKCDLAAPRIGLVICPLDEKHLGLAALLGKAKDEGNRRPANAGCLCFNRIVTGNSFPEPRDVGMLAQPIERAHTVALARCSAKNPTVPRTTRASVGGASVTGCDAPNP